MGTQAVIYNRSDAVRRCLEDISNEQSRAAAEKEGTRIARISGAKLFHSEKDLSPASGIARDAQGRTFVSDEFNHRIAVYGPDLKLQTTIGSQGAGAGQFHYPRGLAFDAGGTLYVADAWNHRIVLIGPDLAFKSAIGKLGDKPGELDEPCGVAIAGGRLFVVEKSNHRVQAFGLDGTPLGVIGRRGTVEEQEQFSLLPGGQETFQPPGFEFPSAIATDRDGNLYVADTNNHRIVKIRPDLGYDSSFCPGGLRYPVGTACDAEGNIHVTQFNSDGVLAISPEAVRLYRYLLPGIETPVSICIAGANTLVAGGMKAGICALDIDPRHDTNAALEDEFSFHLRNGVCAAGRGDWETASAHLSLLSPAPVNEAREIAALLPDAGFTLADGRPAAEPAPFIAALDALADALWQELNARMEAKQDAADENAVATLQLEKALLIGGDAIDPLMVARFRSIKKLHNISSAIKRTASGLKKLEELRRRFAYAGWGAGSRLGRLSLNLQWITEWKRKKESWVLAAAQEAPSLSFNSLPDERGPFARNESRIDLLGYEMRMLWGFAAAQNLELAALLEDTAPAEQELFSYAFAAADFAVHCPEDFATRLGYLPTLDQLLAAMGPEKVSAMMGNLKAAALWAKLGREDNIPHETNAETYRLLPALWAGGALETDGPVDAVSWDKISAFYLGEFRKFIGENTPLRTELARTAQLQPMTEKADPKQSAVLSRKLGLLRFHNLFQERYIGNMMAEYTVRFALFRLKDRPVDAAKTAATADALEKAIRETSVARFDAELESVSLWEKTAATTDIGEKQKLRLQLALTLMAQDYHKLLLAHLAAAAAAIGGTRGEGAKAPRPARPLSTGRHIALPFFPSGATFGPDGNLYVLARFGIFVFDANGRFVRSIGGYGKARGCFTAPMDIAFTPDGTIIATQLASRSIAVFSPDGCHRGDIALKGDEGRQALRIQSDGVGNLYLSFVDGGDMAVYDHNGNKAGGIARQGGPLAYIERLHGFAIKDGTLITGGNGRFTTTTLDGKTAITGLASDIPFGSLASICADANGAVYATDYKNSLVLAVDPSFSAVSMIAPLRSTGITAVAARDGVLALCDYSLHRIIIARL